MPTATGGETISERLTRLRAEQTTVRATIDRALSNGQSNTINGSHVTEIAFERARNRDAALSREIETLERRLANTRPNTGKAITKSISS